MMTRARACALCLSLMVGAGGGCGSARDQRSPAVGEAARRIPSIPPSTVAITANDPDPPRALRRCFAEQPAWSEAAVSDLLDKASSLFEKDDFGGALACAEEAARAAPRSVEAHHDRAVALLHLARLDEARDALALALALDPDDAETLEASADLHINQLAPSADRSAIGLEQARRGFRRVHRRERTRAARLALLEGQALIDLGRSDEAIRRLDNALVLAPRLTSARYEKGVAEFELCLFEDARRTFQRVLDVVPDHTHALFHRGLIHERLGDDVAARKDFDAASRHDPHSFPRPPVLSAADFAARVHHIVGELNADERADIGQVRLETADMPAFDDLVAEKPPLSPTILGLFRGLPLGWGGAADRPPQAQLRRVVKGKARRAPGQGSAPFSPNLPAPAVADVRGGAACASTDRTIVLYRRNLLRSVRDLKELDAAIRRTLSHELGHLRGEDDGSLRDRGLE